MAEVEEGEEKTEEETLGKNHGIPWERRRAHRPKHLNGCATRLLSSPRQDKDLGFVSSIK